MSHLPRVLFLLSLPFAIAFGAPAVARAAVILTAEVYETPGLPGYQTYDITATIEDGFLNTFGFYGEEDGRSMGINGPMLQQDFMGGGIISNAPDDSGFLVDQEVGLSLFLSESEESLEGVFSYLGLTLGAASQRQSYRSWTFVRVVTDAPQEVELFGGLAADRHYADGTGGEIFGLDIDTLLSDIEIGPAPTLGDFPSPPVVIPPVLPPQPPSGGTIDVPPVVETPIISEPDPPVVIVPDPPVVIVPDPPIVVVPPVVENETPLAEVEAPIFTTPAVVFIDENPGDILRWQPTAFFQNNNFAIDTVDPTTWTFQAFDDDSSANSVAYAGIAFGDVAATDLAAKVPEPYTSLLLVIGVAVFTPIRRRVERGCCFE